MSSVARRAGLLTTRQRSRSSAPTGRHPRSGGAGGRGDGHSARTRCRADRPAAPCEPATLARLCCQDEASVPRRSATGSARQRVDPRRSNGNASESLLGHFLMSAIPGSIASPAAAVRASAAWSPSRCSRCPAALYLLIAFAVPLALLLVPACVSDGRLTLAGYAKFSRRSLQLDGLPTRCAPPRSPP